MSPLDLIPVQYKAIAIAIAIVAAAAAVLAWGEWRDSKGYARGQEAKQAEWNADKVKQATENAKDTREILKGQLDAQNQFNALATRLMDDAAAGRVVNDRLLGTVNAAVTRAVPADPSSLADRAAASAATRVLADLFISANARAGLLGEVADRRYAAGKQCEAEYDAVYKTLMEKVGGK